MSVHKQAIDAIGAAGEKQRVYRVKFGESEYFASAASQAAAALEVVGEDNVSLLTLREKNNALIADLLAKRGEQSAQ